MLKPRRKGWQTVMETEFPLTAVINVMSHWGEIREKTVRGKKTSIILLLKMPLSWGLLLEVGIG